MAQYGVWLASWTLALALDPVKGFLYVILPQLHGLHWLLTTNYLQHAHADGSHEGRHGEQLAYARNVIVVPGYGLAVAQAPAPGIACVASRTTTMSVEMPAATCGTNPPGSRRACISRPSDSTR